MNVAQMRQRLADRIPAASGRWFEVRNHDTDKAVVRIYDHIDPLGVTAEELVRELDTITAPHIEVQINSPGGLVFDRIAIYNALRAHPAHVTTRVDGIAASAASVIVQAGDRRVMVESAQLMIHEAWGAAVGPATELREFADLLDKQNDVIAAIYAARSHKTVDEFRELMTRDTYLTDRETVDLGLADDIYRPPRQDHAAAASTPTSRQSLELVRAVLDEQLLALAVRRQQDRLTAAVRTALANHLTGSAGDRP